MAFSPALYRGNWITLVSSSQGGKVGKYRVKDRVHHHGHRNEKVAASVLVTPSFSEDEERQREKKIKPRINASPRTCIVQVRLE